MDGNVQWFVRDLVTLLQEKYNQSLEGYQASPIASHEGAFRQGLNFGYYDALDLIRSQLLAFGYAVEPLEPIVPDLGTRMEPTDTAKPPLLPPGEPERPVPELTNSERTVALRIELLTNDWLDVEPSRLDFENWIPFRLSLLVDDQEAYSYPDTAGATFSLFELNGLIAAVRNLTTAKAEGRQPEAIRFASCEAFFELDVWDNLEPDSVTVAVWINMGSLTNGQVYGYAPGYRFDVDLPVLRRFAEALEQALQRILHP